MRNIGGVGCHDHSRRSTMQMRRDFRSDSLPASSSEFHWSSSRMIIRTCPSSVAWMIDRSSTRHGNSLKSHFFPVQTDRWLTKEYGKLISRQNYENTFINRSDQNDWLNIDHRAEHFLFVWLWCVRLLSRWLIRKKRRLKLRGVKLHFSDVRPSPEGFSRHPTQYIRSCWSRYIRSRSAEASRRCVFVCFHCRHDHSRLILASYAPFLSLSNRADLFSTDDNPGPGSYDIRSNPMPTIKVRWD